MTAIGTTEKNKIRFLLGYSSTAVPWGDQALLQRALNRTDYSTVEVSEIHNQILRCERTWAEIETAGDDIAYRRLITGDVNRTDTEFRSERPAARRRAFLYEADQLALSLGVRNYRSPENSQYIHYGLPNP
jgi:hypothetical protein